MSLRWFWPGSATTASVLKNDLGSSLGQSLLLMDNLDVILFVWKEAVGKFSCIVITAERRLNCEVPVGIRSWEQSDHFIYWCKKQAKVLCPGMEPDEMANEMQNSKSSLISYCWELLGKGQSPAVTKPMQLACPVVCGSNGQGGNCGGSGGRW